MHRSVLQNKKYIKWSEKNSVEVIYVAGIQAAVSSGKKEAATYTAKGPDGKELEFLVEWPNLTVEQLTKLGQSGAAKFPNKGYPNTVIVDPHTLEAFDSFGGSVPSSRITDAAAALQKSLKKQHGKGVSRKTLSKLEKQENDVRKDLADGALNKALVGAGKLEQAAAKLPQALQDNAAKVKADVVAACGAKLDEIEALIGRGESKAAARELGSLARALKGTELADRANELLAKAKSG